MEPFGEYVSRNGGTTIIIGIDQSVKVFFPNSELGIPIFEGAFTNFDELKGTEFHNFANPVYVSSNNKEQADLMFHISDDCHLMKGGPRIRANGLRIEVDDSLFWRQIEINE